ncbi:DUF6190 family protein [Salinisphaera sp. SPP-AMP-43]|uniref:DUF6190 family protein n=1 Tax=Salinisphaera sp. SPP-AMP-43 TaxID=3121288 RepID=UPI003C6DD05E
MAVIDATVFMGMHHALNDRRQRALKVVMSNFDEGFEISFDQIGICDSIVWRRPREVQDAYYPFMDVLHTEMPFRRRGYSLATIERAANDPQLAEIRTSSPSCALLAASVIEESELLYTFDPVLLKSQPTVRYVACSYGTQPGGIRSGGSFPGELQQLYNESRSLVITENDFGHA